MQALKLYLIGVQIIHKLWKRAEDLLQYCSNKQIWSCVCILLVPDLLISCYKPAADLLQACWLYTELLQACSNNLLSPKQFKNFLVVSDKLVAT